MLATFVREARFEPVDGADMSPVGRMFLVPRDGLRLRVTPREQ
jgi:cytochrome P450